MDSLFKPQIQAIEPAGAQLTRDGLVGFAKWLSSERTADELAEARRELKQYEKAIADLEVNVKERLKDFVNKTGERATDATVRLKVVGGRVDLVTARAKDPDVSATKQLCLVKGIEFSRVCRTTVVIEPDAGLLQKLVLGGTITAEEYESCFVKRETLKVF